MECPDLWEIENSLFAQGCGCLCGVDEAGAGPLAGRVYAGAVILPRGWGHPYLNDSKQVTERRREILYDRICQEAVAWSVAWAEVEEIDRINILRARLLAMERAIQGLSRRPDLALVDGNRSEGITVPCRTVVKGDRKSAYRCCLHPGQGLRDRHMGEMAAAHPVYGFERHKAPHPAALPAAAPVWPPAPSTAGPS
ncbi:MAG: ribonuclease HII [Evtepia gabavorous]